MKFVILLALFAIVFAQEKEVEVLQDVREGPVGAVYSYAIELDNGIRFNEHGYEGSEGQANAEGSYAFVAPDGTPIEVTYVADEGGFQAESDAIPKAPPLPLHAEEQVRIAAQQKADGIEFDDRGFEI